MHSKALNLLKECVEIIVHTIAHGLIYHRLSEQETDKHDKLMPSVTYLQRLGPQYMDQIFEFAHWIFEADAEIGLEVWGIGVSLEARAYLFVDLHLRGS